MSARSQAKKKRSKQRADRAARSAYLTNRAADTATYWHGGRPGMTPGTVLLGRADAEATGVDLSFYSGTDVAGDPVPEPDRVYMSSDREFARGFAGLMQLRDTQTGVASHGALYAVEPIGDVEADPDFASSEVSWSAPKARIAAVVEEDVDLDLYEIGARIGPHQEWVDQSPVYTAEGEYLPSPEQVETSTPDQIDWLRSILPPWTPVQAINAWIGGGPSGHRPNPEDHPGVLYGGAEAIHVLATHRPRAAALTNAGVEVRSADLPDVGPVNDLLAATDQTQVTRSDKRLVMVATHPRDGVVGGAVVTAFPYNDHILSFLDAIVVAPPWRRHGVGTALLQGVNVALPSRLWFMGGRCDPNVSGFFASRGFTVLHPGVDLIVPTRPEPQMLQTDGPTERTWFYRQGPT